MIAELMPKLKSGLPRSFHTPLAVICALWLACGSGVASASAGANTEVVPPPLLSIAVDGANEQVESGDEVTYTAILENLGTASVAATVVLTVPSYLTLGSGSDAAVEDSDATWVTELASGARAEFVIDAVIGEIPQAERRVTTVVSVFAGDPAALIVRTADAANIVGVEDTPNEVAQEAAEDAAGAEERRLLMITLVSVAVVFVVLLIATAVVVLRSRAARRDH